MSLCTTFMVGVVIYNGHGWVCLWNRVVHLCMGLQLSFVRRYIMLMVLIC